MVNSKDQTLSHLIWIKANFLYKAINTHSQPDRTASMAMHTLISQTTLGTQRMPIVHRLYLSTGIIIFIKYQKYLHSFNKSFCNLSHGSFSFTKTIYSAMDNATKSVFHNGKKSHTH